MNQPGNVHPPAEAKNSGSVELEDQWFEVYRISVWSVRIEVPGRTCDEGTLAASYWRAAGPANR